MRIKYLLLGLMMLLLPNLVSAVLVDCATVCTDQGTYWECTGSITCHYLGAGSDNIWIHDATITATQASSYGFFNLTTSGWINITETTVNGYGFSPGTCNTAGSPAYLYLTAKDGAFINHSTFNSYGGTGSGYCGGGSPGGNGASSTVEVNISNSPYFGYVTINAYGGNGGQGAWSLGDPAGSGGSGNGDFYLYGDAQILGADWDFGGGHGGSATSSAPHGSGGWGYLDFYGSTLISFNQSDIDYRGGTEGSGGSGSGRTAGNTQSWYYADTINFVDDCDFDARMGSGQMTSNGTFIVGVDALMLFDNQTLPIGQVFQFSSSYMYPNLTLSSAEPSLGLFDISFDDSAPVTVYCGGDLTVGNYTTIDSDISFDSSCGTISWKDHQTFFGNFPSDIEVYIDDVLVATYPSVLDSEQELDLNDTVVNQWIATNCPLGDCDMPITFRSATEGIFEYSDINLTYERDDVGYTECGPTSDKTPDFYFTTDSDANCTLNGTICSTTGGTEHSCTPTLQQGDHQTIHIECVDEFGQEANYTTHGSYLFNITATGYPTVNLLSPPNDTTTAITINPTLVINISDDEGDTMNVTFYEYNLTSGESSIITTFLEQTDGNVSYQWSSRTENTIYAWFAGATDGYYATNTSYWEFLTINITRVNVTLNEPDNYSHLLYYQIKDSGVVFNFTALYGDFDVTECELWANFSGTFEANQTNSSAIINHTLFNFDPQSLSRGTYIWNVRCVDTEGVDDFGDFNYTLFIDNSVPYWIHNISNVTENEDFGNISYLTNLSDYVEDLDNDTLIFTVANQNTSEVICEVNGDNLNLISVANWYGNASCELNVVDSFGDDGGNMIFGIQVLGINDAPYFVQNITSPQSVNATYPYYYDVNCSDAEGHTITYYDNTTLYDINSSTGVISFTPTESQVGTYNIKITCGDFQYNTSQSYILMINETVPPQLYQVTPLDNARTIGTNQELVYNVSDYSGIENCTLYVNGTINQTDTSVDNNEYNYFYLPVVEGASYLWSITCWDNSPQRNYNATNNRSFKVNTPPPPTNLTQPSNASFVGGDTNQLSWATVVDPDGDTVYYYVWFEQADPPSFYMSTPSTTAFITTASSGRYYWYAKTYDGYEFSNATDTWYFDKATDPPVLTNAAPTESVIDSDTALFNVTIVHDNLDTSSVELNLEGSWYGLTSWDYDGNQTYWFYRTISGITSGNKTFYYSAKNGAGVLGISDASYVYFAPDAPIINFTDPTPANESFWNTTLQGISAVINVTVSSTFPNISKLWYDKYIVGEIVYSNNVTMTDDVAAMPVDETSEYRYYACHTDQQGRTTCTDTRILYVYPTPYPRFTSINETSDPVYYESKFNLSADILSDYGEVHTAILEVNWSGTLTNFTTTKAGDSYWYELDTMHYGVGNMSYKFYTNNSYGNWNISDVNVIELDKFQTVLTMLVDGNTDNFNIYTTDDWYTKGYLINGSVDCVYCTELLYLYNTTGLILSQASPLGTNQTYNISLTNNMTFIINNSGTDNYTGVSESIAATILSPITNIPILLDNLNVSRKYEFGTYANISATIPANVTSTKPLCIDVIHPDGVLTCEYDTVNYTFEINRLIIDEFEVSQSYVTLNTTESTYFEMNEKSYFMGGNFSLSGVEDPVNGYPKDIRMYIGNMSSVSDILFGYLNDTILHMYQFDDGTTSKNLTYQVAGSDTVYLNVSKAINPINNISLTFIGSDLDIGNNFSYHEYFKNTNFINSSLTTASLGYMFDEMNVNSSSRLDDLTVTSGSSYNYGSNGDYVSWRTYSSCSVSCGCGYWHCGDGCSCSTSNGGYRTTSGLQAEKSAIIDFRFGCSGSSYSACYACGAPSGGRTCQSASYSCSAYLGSSYIDGISGSYTYRLILNDSDSGLWSVYKNGVYYKQFTNTGTNLELKFSGSAGGSASVDPDCNPGSSIGTSPYSQVYIYYVNYSGVSDFWNGTEFYGQNGTLLTTVLFDAPNPISRVYIEGDEYTPTGTDIYYELSVDGGDSWEEALLDEYTTFDVGGTELMCRINLSSTITDDAPVLRNLKYSIIPSSVSGLSVDLNADGDEEYEFAGNLNSSNSPLTVSLNHTPLDTYLSNLPDGTITGRFPIRITTETAGILEVRDPDMQGDLSEFQIDSDDYLNDNGRVYINTTFTDSLINLSNLEISIKGSGNISVRSYVEDDPSTYSSTVIQVILSLVNVDMPYKVNYWSPIIWSLHQSQAEPYGQDYARGIPFWRLEPNRTDSNNQFDVYVKVNETLPSCITYTLNSSDGHNIFVNQSGKRIMSNLSYAPTYVNGTIYDFLDLDCSTPPSDMDVTQIWSPLCSECYFRQEFVD